MAARDATSHARGGEAVTVHLPADLRAAEAGRAVVRPFLRGGSPERVWDTEVLVSELVTNAVLHGRPDRDGHVTLSVETDGPVVHVAVEDRGPGLPHDLPDDPPPWRPHGRGLALVRGLADRWGYRRRPSRIWFVLDLRRP